MLKIGDKAVDFSLTIYGGGAYNFNQAGYPNKTTILSFIDINNSWDWIYYLLRFRAEYSTTDVDMIAIIFNSVGNMNSGLIDNKFPPPAGAGTERRFTRANLQSTAGLTVLIDNTWASSIASDYQNGFSSVNDPSFNGSSGTSSWSYIISKEFYITDKWNTNCTTNGDPLSFLRFQLFISHLQIAGTFVAGNTARIALDPLGLAGNYIDIAYNGIVYTYTVSCPGVTSVTPTNGTTSSSLVPIAIQFAADTPAANNSANYTLTTEAGAAIAGLAVTSLNYATAFTSASAYSGVVQRYLKQRIDNLIAVPRVLQVIPQFGGYIESLPGSRIDIVLSKPVGDINGAAPEAILDITDIKRIANYELYEPNGLTLSSILYENSGLRSANIDNIGKIENVVTLTFTGSLVEGAFGIRVNNNPTANERIQDTNGVDYLEGNNGDPYYTIGYTVDLTVPAIESISSTTLNDTYKEYDTIDIEVNFSEAVTLAGGNLNVTLDTGAVVSVSAAVYPATQLAGTYTVQAGENSTDLNVTGIALSAGTLKDNAGHDADLTLPAGDNLADNCDIVIDTTAPANTAGYPAADTATATGFTVKAMINENGTAYYEVLANGAGAPSSAQVKAGVDASGSAALKSGSIALTAGTEGSSAVTGLSGNTDYDVFVVAEDSVQNIQASPVKVDIKTLSVLSSAKDITGFVIDTVSGTIGANTISLTMPEGTDITNLVPAITVSPGASVSPASGAATDFTSPVAYTVTAEDASTKVYTVTVRAAYVFIRDTLSDNGTEAYTANACHSPDIIIWADSTADSSTFPLTGNTYGGNIIEIGQPNYIYLRILNRSNTELPASTLKAKLCYGPLITLLYPGSPDPVTWTDVTTVDIDIPAVPAASGVTPGYAVSSVIEWTPDPDVVSEGFDAYCLIAMFRKTTEDFPDEYTTITDWTEYLQFINSHKNVAFKNIATQDAIIPNPSPMPLPGFHVQGFKKKFKWDLELDVKDLPAGSVVSININNKILGKKPELINMKELNLKKKSTQRWFRVNEKKAGVMKNLELPDDKIHRCDLKLLLPANARHKKEYNLRVSQRVGKEILGSVNYVIRGIEFDKAKYIGLLSNHLVHKRDCTSLAKMPKDNMVPFESLADARKKGFDPALDCLNSPFKLRDVSGRLQYKILQYLNSVKSEKDLQKRIVDTLGIGYFRDRYGITDRMGMGLTESTAREIIRQRNRLGKFTRLEQVDNIVGVGRDTLIDIVNSFKDGDVSDAGRQPGKLSKAKKPAKAKKQAKPVKAVKTTKAKMPVKAKKPVKTKTQTKPVKKQIKAVKPIKAKMVVKKVKVSKPAKLKTQTKQAKTVTQTKTKKPVVKAGGLNRGIKKQTKAVKPVKPKKAVKKGKVIKPVKPKKAIKKAKAKKPAK
ncbi:MAG: hypothetical protein V1874_02880 [Spirochaetota bacterium]